MIIWSGWGWLVGLFWVSAVVLSGFAGVAVKGTAFAGCDLAIGLAAVALLNFLTFRWFAGRGSSGGTLFFIPSRFWTWIMVAVGLVSLTFGIQGERQHAADLKKYPGMAAFLVADGLIDNHTGAVAFGNNEAEQQTAQAFSDLMKERMPKVFTGGGGKTLATGGHFLTYCRRTVEGIVLLVHVPELRNYPEGEVRDALVELAWECARQAVAEGATPVDLVVALRGFVSYGPIMEGLSDGAPQISTSGDQTRLYRYFDSEAGGA